MILLAAACTGGASESDFDGANAEEGPEDSGVEGGAGDDATARAQQDQVVSLRFEDSDEVLIGREQLAAIVDPTLANPEIVQGFYGGSPPENFELIVINQLIRQTLVTVELETREGTVGTPDVDASRDVLIEQLAGRLNASVDPLGDATRMLDEVPYLQFLSEALASEIALGRHLEDNAGPDEGDPCVRHLLVETEAEAAAALAEVEAGTEFEVAVVTTSIGPSAERGGDLGCTPPDAYVAEFANAVIGAAQGEVIGPIETEFGWHLIRVEGYAVDGARLAQSLIQQRADFASVDVDPAVGFWDPATIAVIEDG